jgi:hypothetical protein
MAFPLSAKADLGPKPSMQFNFIYETTEPVTIVSGEQFVCEKKDCSDAKKLEDYGPQGFRCTNVGCESLAYGYRGEYNFIVMKFSDKTRKSNIFVNITFDSKYNVTVYDDKLLIENDSQQLNDTKTVKFFLNTKTAKMALALIITTIVELLAGFIIIYKKGLPKKILLLIFVLNFITLPLFWLIMNNLTSGEFLDYIFGEILVMLVESAAIFALFKKYLNFKTALKIGITINLFSWFLGEFIENLIHTITSWL